MNSSNLAFSILLHFQRDNSKRTPLMAAALSGADKSVRLLLKYGAHPDVTDKDDNTALLAAVEAGATTTIDILAPVTSVGYSVAQTVDLMAKYHHKIKLTKPLKGFLRRCSENHNVLEQGILSACHYGAVDLFNQLTQGFSKTLLRHLLGWTRLPSATPHPKFQDFQEVMTSFSLINSSVMADSPELCTKVLKLSDFVPEDVKATAKMRGNRAVMDVLKVGNGIDKEKAKQKLQTTVINKTAGILDLVPRFVEFEYEDKKDKILPLLTQNTVLYSTLLDNLLIPEVHTDTQTLHG